MKISFSIHLPLVSTFAPTEPEAFTNCLLSSIFALVLGNVFTKRPNSFGELECSFFKIIYWFVIWNFGHWYLFVICDLLFVISINLNML